MMKEKEERKKREGALTVLRYLPDANKGTCTSSYAIMRKNGRSCMNSIST